VRWPRRSEQSLAHSAIRLKSKISKIKISIYLIHIHRQAAVVYAHEVYAREMHAHEVHAREMHAYEIHVTICGLTARDRGSRAVAPMASWSWRGSHGEHGPGGPSGSVKRAAGAEGATPRNIGI
jgi:hypothetical protein